MAYTPVTVSNYNSNPPDDDGTVSEANRGKWSTVKEKLSDPLKTAIESIDSQLQTELGNVPALGTAVTTTSGREAAFTSIPSWATKIEIGFVGVSLDGGTDNMLIQLGDSGGYENTGYLWGVSNESGGSQANSTNGFQLNVNTAAAAIWHGIATLVLVDSANFTWACMAQIGRSDTAGGINQGGGSKSLSAALDRLRIQLSGSTDDFDAGTINIRYS